VRFSPECISRPIMDVILLCRAVVFAMHEQSMRRVVVLRHPWGDAEMYARGYAIHSGRVFHNFARRDILYIMYLDMSRAGDV